MKILVFSDSHHNYQEMFGIIRKIPRLDLIVHLGDNVSDAHAIESEFPQIPLVYVAGNCDWPSPSELNEVVLNLENAKVLITHGHLRNVKSTYNFLLNDARQKRCNLVLFGHTHVPLDIFDDEIKLFNPGSISRPPMGTKASYGFIEINGGKIDTNVVFLD
ncbi:MAG: metallophosphoesterase [Clostridia bacterium]|nr:metallophosphoesterase [Clostridia bacterium]